MRNLVNVGKVAAWISAVVPCLFLISDLTGFTSYANQTLDGDDRPELLILVLLVVVWVFATVTGCLTGVLLYKTRPRASFVNCLICGLSFLILIMWEHK